MPLLGKGAKDGNTPRYVRLASTELLVLMPVRCTLALTLRLVLLLSAVQQVILLEQYITSHGC